MYVSHLSLTNFRNYNRLELPLTAGTTILHGANAQGKTNILEALYYLATTRSPHTNHDHQLINWTAAEEGMPVVVGRLVVQVKDSHGQRLLELRLIQEQQERRLSFRREALVDRRPVRLMDLLGQLRVVLFLPRDMHLITGSPANRRRYIDITLCQTDAHYCRQLSAYNKHLEQRNATLRRIAEQKRGHDMLPIFTEKVVSLGAQVFARRARFMQELARETQHIHYEQLTQGRETIRLRYLPRLLAGVRTVYQDEDEQEMAEIASWLEKKETSLTDIEARFDKALKEAQAYDLARTQTSVGPHRDDWHFWVNGRDLADFGSRGQQRSAILALKMGEINWIESQTNDKPILLLDEVLSELDPMRQKALLGTVNNAQQSFLTTTSLDSFTPAFMVQTTPLFVQNGRVTVTTTSSSPTSS
ncbi:MAG TPA: DNA replication/repair protein RecF [Anaerolineae bacterium]|nr:DNA replication/repair protein RecF [Anaerolineae bacterium]